jgi:Protein of unknown function (DUF3822)
MGCGRSTSGPTQLSFSCSIVANAGLFEADVKLNYPFFDINVHIELQKNTPTLEIKDEHFDADRLADYELCLEIGDARFRYGVFETTSKAFRWLADYSFSSLLNENQLLNSLHQLYLEHPVLGSNRWKSIKVVINNATFTLIPEDFFRKEYATQYVQIMRGSALRDQEMVLSHPIANSAARNVFVADRLLWEWLQHTYSMHRITIFHQSSALIAGTTLLANSLGKTVACMYFEDDMLTLCIVKEGQLLFCNKYLHKAATDLTYYVLFVLNTLHILPSVLYCELSGEITPYSESYQLLQKFLPNLRFGTLLEGLQLGDAFENLPEHRYFSLYCASLLI